MKTALITGGTDGIGKGLALALAHRGYAVHITGRSIERSETTLQELRKLNPEGVHKKYLFDLSDISKVVAFAQEYREEHQTLDLMILNANSAIKTIQLTDDGIEKNFAVGYISRYILSVALDEILAKSNGRVVHIGIASSARKLNFEKIRQANYGIIQALTQAYAVDTLLAAQINKRGLFGVAHEMHDPGMVNTRQVKEQGFLIRTLAGFFAREADEVGEIIVSHLDQVDAMQSAGKNFKLGKTSKVSSAALNEEDFDKLIFLSAQLTKMELRKKSCNA